MVLLRDDPLDCGDDVENNFNNNNTPFNRSYNPNRNINQY